MPDGSDTPDNQEYTIRALASMAEVDATQWNNCAGLENPLLSHEFLSALEETGAVCAETGWLPQHIIMQHANGDLMASMPMYLKGHSYGEYVFDWSWADAYERAGGRYYPKLLSAIPFTPVTGNRLLVPDGDNQTIIRQALSEGVQNFSSQLGVSSLHVNYLTKAEANIFSDAGYMMRHGHQFHWVNNSYQSFDSFLATLNSRKRKAIKKERRQLQESGITVRQLTGDELKSSDWDAFYFFYKDTYDRKWGSPYMNRDTFQLFHETMRDKILLVMAYEDDQPIAGALNFIGSNALYGRNWGAIVDYKFLHFEACYYQAIDFAIERGLKTVEAGTQGEHKIQRGYLPTKTYSAHYFRDQGFGDAIDRFLHQERAMEAENMQHLMEYSPYRQTE